jgi:hypothetical protein
METIFSSLNLLPFMTHLSEPVFQIFTGPKIPVQVTGGSWLQPGLLGNFLQSDFSD